MQHHSLITSHHSSNLIDNTPENQGWIDHLQPQYVNYALCLSASALETPTALSLHPYNTVKYPTHPTILQIIVEYDSADVDRFIEIADSLETAFPGILVDGIEKETTTITTTSSSEFSFLDEDGTVLLNTASKTSIDDILRHLDQHIAKPSSS